jgi:hypothetical protein
VIESNYSASGVVGIMLRSVPEHLFPSPVPELQLRNSLGFPHPYPSPVPEPWLQYSLSKPFVPLVPLASYIYPASFPVPSSHTIPISPDAASLHSHLPDHSSPRLGLQLSYIKPPVMYLVPRLKSISLPVKPDIYL